MKVMSGKATSTLFIVAAAAAIILSVRAGLAIFNTEDTSFDGMDLRCVIDLSAKGNLPGLTIGHNYELLNKYAESRQEGSVSVFLAEAGSNYLDSLKTGAVDLVVLPWTDSLQTDSVSFSKPIEDRTVWAIASKYKKGLIEVDSWLESYTSTEEYSQRRDMFIYRYSPSRRAAGCREVEAISPYDDLLKHYSQDLGWDWRLLAAIVYQESKFHIEAVSPRGAQGLMQVRPVTAGRFGVTDLLDPEQNIRSGTAFIKRLQGMFKSKSANPAEHLKITLAAYNAGEGKISDCMNLAGYMGLDPGYWDNLVSVIPQMRDSSIFEIDTVKHGMFHGGETISYVEKVLEIYEDFKAIYPEEP